MYYKKNKYNRLLYLLLPLAGIYRSVIALRKWCYQSSIFKMHKMAVPVIVVGNITLGGTGKTPLVIRLAQLLKQHGYKPGIVSRGYAGKGKNYPIIVNENSLASEVGDEPVLIFKRTQCPVIVDPKRVNAAKYLLEQFDCDVIISDDGMQHYALDRDIEIAVIDGERRFGNNLSFPAGPLREPKRRLREVDFVVANGHGQNGEHQMAIKPEFFVNLLTGEKILAHEVQPQKVHAVAGIGNPARFFATLQLMDFTVIPHTLPDHHQFVAKDIHFDDDNLVIMTEKDAVKCRHFAGAEHWYLSVSAEMGRSFEQAILEKLKKS